jgi:hypothetical protein
MSRKHAEPDVLAEFQKALDESAAYWRDKEPTPPWRWLEAFMVKDGLSSMDVARMTQSLSPGFVKKLLDGKETFTDAVCEELRGWLGPRTKVLRSLQVAYDEFHEQKARPAKPPLPDTPETRDAAHWYATLKKRHRGTQASHQ